MATSVIKCLPGVWTLVATSNTDFQVLGDYDAYCKIDSLLAPPADIPPIDEPAFVAKAGIIYQARVDELTDGLYIRAERHCTVNVAIGDFAKTDVLIQDQTTTPVETWLTKEIQIVSLQQNIAQESNTIVLDSFDISPIENERFYHIEIRYAGVRYFQAEIVTITDNGTNVTIEIDTPLDFNVLVAGVDSIVISDSNAVRLSATASPAEGSVELCTYPPANRSWDLTRLMVVADMTSEPDDAKFLGDAPLTWGVYGGARIAVGEKHLVNIKLNADFGATAYDIAYTQRANPQSNYGLRVRKSFNGQDKYGVTIRLQGSNEMFFMALQEDISQNANDLRFKVMGHNLDNF